MLTALLVLATATMFVFSVTAVVLMVAAGITHAMLWAVPMLGLATVAGIIYDRTIATRQ